MQTSESPRSSSQSTSALPTLLDWALLYQKRGWLILPGHSEGKHPRIVWEEIRNVTAEQVREWWRKWPDANICLVTGTVSGVMGIDVDPSHGGNESFTKLETEIGTLPRTLTNHTGGGGFHFLFKTLGVLFRSKVKGLGAGIDIRGEGGILILPPSRHHTGTLYKWDDYSVSPGELPKAWEDRLPRAEKKEKKKTSGTPPSSGSNGHGQTFYEEGFRRTALLTLLGLMQDKGMSTEAIRAALHTENKNKCRPPLFDNEINAMVDDVTKRYEPKHPVTEDLPSVTVHVGRHPEALEQVETILLEHAEAEGLFQRAGELVKIIRLPEARKNTGLARSAGTLMLDPLTHAALLKLFERLIRFEKMCETKKGPTPERINCPDRIAEFYLASKGTWRLPVLEGLISSPLLRLDGSLLDKPGFDSQTGLYLADDGLQVTVADQPSLEDAQKALEILCAPFTEFPFSEEAHKSVAMAGILTAIERRLLAACPLFGFSAPTPRSGKSLLAEAIAIIATGIPAAASTSSPDREEFRKSLTAALREGQQIVNFDNIEHPLKSSELCAILTGSEFSDRVLGETKTLHLPTNVLWTMTGNNLAVRGDLSSRTLLCYINAQKERPEERTFQIADLKAYLREHRAELISAALTILRAYHVARKPPQDVKAWGGFEEWSRFIREPLVWVGMADPCETRESVIDDDPEQDSATDAIRCLQEVFDDVEFTTHDAADRANDTVEGGKRYAFPELHAALSAISGGEKNVDVNRLGKWFRAWKGRIVDGRTIVRATSIGAKTTRWWIQ